MQSEVILLGQLKHSNLVKLIGYCCEEEERVLIYEFLPRGSLENHLFKRNDIFNNYSSHISYDSYHNFGIIISISFSFLIITITSGISISLPWATRLKIAVAAAKGLAFLHDLESPIIYRDFKTSNILLDSVYF